jgi:hypothetical protein
LIVQIKQSGVQGMSREKENAGFICENCGQPVTPLSNGSYRNHCPFCLFSKHIDVTPGDHQNTCGGLMHPIGIKYNSKKGYQIIHRCLRCGRQSINKIAENTVQPDNMDIVVGLTVF